MPSARSLLCVMGRVCDQQNVHADDSTNDETIFPQEIDSLGLAFLTKSCVFSPVVRHSPALESWSTRSLRFYTETLTL